jgi:hypothetical protein
LENLPSNVAAADHLLISLRSARAHPHRLPHSPKQVQTRSDTATLARILPERFFHEKNRTPWIGLPTRAK